MAEEEGTMSNEFLGLAIDTPNLYYTDEPPPPPMISSEGIIATDITRKFAAAAATLAPGELVKDGHFTLFESVGALEIMDPKMDSGCLAPGESLDEEYDVARPLLPSEVLGIIDQLLCLEMAWHLGYPLSQTLLTNVYIEAILMPAPATIDEADFIRNRKDGAPRDPMFAVLRAYCLGLLKSCWYVCDRIKFEHYYEEEDFVTNTYHRSLLDNIDRDLIRDELMTARSILHNIRRTISEEMAQALSFRLELRTAFLRAIELSDLRSNPESLSLPWSQMKAVWEPISKSHRLGTPVPEAFSTKIQRKLASTMPPRPIVHLSFEETYEHFRKLFADGIDVLKVLNYSDSQSLLNFVLTFQAQKPQPLVYIRTLLQTFLFKDMIILGHLSIRHVIDDDLAIVVLPCSRLLDPSNDDIEAPYDPRFAMAHQMELFRQRAAQSYLDIFRALCQNRCRVRRTLYHAIQDWETVQMDAMAIDRLLQVQLEENPIVYKPSFFVIEEDAPDPAYCLPLSSWALLYKLRLMEWIVQLGFELETYQPDELAGMYWYLGHLAKTRGQLVERIKAFTLHRRANHRPPLTQTMEAQYDRSLAFLRAMMLDSVATWEFARVLSCIYTVLLRLKLIVPPPRPYSTDALRYEIRMKPFLSITMPELPTFEEFTHGTTQPECSIAALLESASGAIGSARKSFDVLGKLSEQDAFTVDTHERWLRGTKNCFKSIIAASIAISTLSDATKGGVEGEEGLGLGLEVVVPKPEKGYHEWWIVPKITRKR